MIQHPIPQNVTQYEFHIIGNMTVKQFLEVGGGVLIAVIINAMALPDFIKWPFIILSVVAGAALAFLPFDGRPLDRMVIIFFKAVYSPTQYVWKKQNPVPEFFNFVPRHIKQTPVNEQELQKQRARKNLTEYLSTLPGDAPPTDLDPQEQEYLKTFDELFVMTPPAKEVEDSHRTITIKSSPKVRVRKMKTQAELNPNSTEKLQNTLRSISIDIPENLPIKVESHHIPSPTENTLPQTNLQPQLNQPTVVPVQQVAATVDDTLIFPNAPHSPNTLSGMVLDSQGNAVENAIVEVTDQYNMPVRAFKSNSLGQFFSANKLLDGKYLLAVEKDGLVFDRISLELNGQVVPPLKIVAKGS